MTRTGKLTIAYHECLTTGARELGSALYTRQLVIAHIQERRSVLCRGVTVWLANEYKMSIPQIRN
jgi:hypothetical protein